MEEVDFFNFFFEKALLLWKGIQPYKGSAMCV